MSQSPKAQTEESSAEEVVLGRNELLNLPEPSVHKVYIEGLGSYVHMKEISAADQESYETSFVKMEEQPNGEIKTRYDMTGAKAKYLVRVLCDKKGKRLFSDEEFGQLGRKFPQTIDELHRKALEINGISREAQEEEGKNSETKSAGSNTG